MSRNPKSVWIPATSCSVLLVGLVAVVALAVLASALDGMWGDRLVVEFKVDSVLRTFVYTISATTFQFVIGGAIGWTVYYLRYSARRMPSQIESMLMSGLMVVYCLQPMLVWYAVVHLFGFPDRSLWALIAATSWQYAGFVVLFIVLTLREAPDNDVELCGIETPWNVERLRMTFGPTLLAVLFSLWCVRFAWNASKYELPSRFQQAVGTHERVLAVRLAKEAHLRPQLYWGLCIALLCLIGAVVAHFVLRHGVRWLLRRPSNTRSSGGPKGARMATRIGVCLLVGYAATGAIVYSGLDVAPVDELLMSVRPILTSCIVAAVSALVATFVAMLVVYAFSRSNSVIPVLWAGSSRLIVAVPLVLIGALAASAARQQSVERFTAVAWQSGLSSVVTYPILLAVVKSVPMIVAYILFLTPLIYPIIHEHYHRLVAKETEELAEIDGNGRGYKHLAHAVLPRMRPTLGLASFLAFTVVFQDLSVAKWFVDDTLRFFSYEFLAIELSDRSGFSVLLTWSLVIAAFQGLIFYFVYRCLPRTGFQ